NEVQQFSLNGTASGTFTPSFNGLSATTPLTVTDEMQTITLGGSSGGTVQLRFNGNSPSNVSEVETITRNLDLATTFSFNGVTSSSITLGAATTAANISTTLSTIPALTGNINVTGSAGGPYTVTFTNAL